MGRPGKEPVKEDLAKTKVTLVVRNTVCVPSVGQPEREILSCKVLNELPEQWKQSLSQLPLCWATTIMLRKWYMGIKKQTKKIWLLYVE